MDRNHPDIPDDPLLASAIRVLTEEPTTFEVKPWREVMAKAQAKEKAKGLKEATKKAEAKGIVPPDFKSVEQTSVHELPAGLPKVDPADPFGLVAKAQVKQGIDSAGSDMVYSEFGVDGDPATQPTGETTMEAPVQEQTTAEAAVDPTPAPTKQELAEKAQKERMALKAAKIEAETKAREAAALARKEKAEQAALAKVTKLEDAKTKAAESGDKRTYFGSMLTLAERVKSGVYVKGTNGQLRCGDEVALALDGVSPGNVVRLLVEVLSAAKLIEGNPYTSLNIGQQSMNLRNKLRGAVKAGTVTIEALKAARDVGGFADAEQLIAEKAAKAKERAESKAALLASVTKPEGAKAAAAVV